MADAPPIDRLLKVVEEDLVRVDRHAARYRRHNSIIIVGGILASTLATLLAGGMAAGGPPVANVFAGWRIGCAIVAILAAVAAIITALSERFKVSEHLANSSACAARLGSLRFTLRSSAPDLKQSEDQYREILEKYRMYLL
jgi:MFS family permease